MQTLEAERVLVIDRIDENWLRSTHDKFQTFTERHFADNVGNAVFNHFKSIFNVFIVQDTASNSEQLQTVFFEPPVQTLLIPFADSRFVVYVFRSGRITVPKSLQTWTALGTHFRKETEDHSTVIDFVFRK